MEVRPVAATKPRQIPETGRSPSLRSSIDQMMTEAGDSETGGRDPQARGSRFQTPELPPVFSHSMSWPMLMVRSVVLHMS